MARVRLKVPKEPPLQRITIRGFKAFRDPATLTVRPLTLLAGRNSSGKSSALQPLLLLKQTAEASFDAGPLLLDGPCLSVDRADALLWTDRDGVSKSFTLELEFETQRPQSLQLSFARGRSGFDLGPTRWTVDDRSVELQTGIPSESTQAELRKRLHLPDVPMSIGVWSGFAHTVEAELDSGGLTTIASPTRSLFDATDVLYLPGLRFRSRRYRATRAGPKFPGPFPEYTAALVEAWQEADDDRLKEVIRQMELMELALDVAAERHSDVEIELQVRQRGARMVSVADTGLGVSQALPVLMALRVARQGQLLHIEQPELHLHPNAQVRLVSALAAAASRGVRVVVETHSSLLLKAVQVAISEGHLPPSLVALHWFTQDEAGATRITSAYPDEIGAYGDWPVDFASVELGIEERFIRASLSHAG